MKTFLQAVLLLCFYVVSLSADEKLSLQLLWKHQFEFAGFYIAKEKGYYSNAGLDVEIKEFNFGIDIVDDVTSGKSDIGIGRSSLVLDKLNGSNIIFLNALYQDSPYVLLSKKRADLDDVKDFKGKTLMLSDDLAAIAAISSMMRINNINTTDYRAIEHSFNIHDLINGKVDIMSSYLSNEPFELKKQGVEYNIFDPKSYGFNFYADILFTSEKFRQNDEQKLQIFQTVSLQGWLYAFEHIEETVDIILEKYNSQNKSREALIYEARILKKLAFPKGIAFGEIDELRIKEIANVYRLLGLSNKSNKQLEGVIYKQKNAFSKLFTKERLVGISLFIFFIVLLAFYRQHLLRKQNETLEELVSVKTNELLQYTHKLEKQQELYDMAYENSSNGVFFIDIQTNKIIECNEQLLKMLRAQSKQEVLNLHPSELSPKLQPDGKRSDLKAQEMLKRAMLVGYNNFKWKHIRVDTSEFWVDVSLTKITKGSKNLIYVTWKDIDDEMQAKKELELLNENLELKIKERTQELEFAIKAKSDFLANMSHEIRTPLNGVIGFIDMLHRDEDDKLKLKKLDIIKESSNSLLTIINDILDFSKIESDKLVIEKIPIYTAHPFKNIVELFLDKAKEKDISITLHTDENLPKKTLGDSTRIKQVFSNLLSNAIKFSHKDTTIVINLNYLKGTNELYCEIIDQGIGISSQNINKVFHSFEQADSSVTRTYGGTGLGLAISKALIGKMGGEIGVVSEEGIGSKFYFTLALFDVTEEVAKEEEFNPDNLHLQGKILIVEDNKTNQILLSMLLEDLSLQYEIANDGLEAIESVKEKHFDLILMDENMPNMNGIEASKIIKKIESAEDIPIIAVTANALKGDREKFLASGMQDYIAKPIDTDELVHVLSKYL